MTYRTTPQTAVATATGRVRIAGPTVVSLTVQLTREGKPSWFRMPKYIREALKRCARQLGGCGLQFFEEVYYGEHEWEPYGGGEPRPVSQQDFAVQTGYSRRQVTSTVQLLEAWGMIRRSGPRSHHVQRYATQEPWNWSVPGLIFVEERRPANVAPRRPRQPR